MVFARTWWYEQVLELTRRALNDISDKPELMLDADYDPFASLVSTVPAYADYRRKLAAATALAVDGKTRVMSISAVRAEIYSPTDATNIAATEKTLDHVKAFAAGMLNTMMNGQAARYVEGGEYSTEKQTQEMIAAFGGTDRNTNACESYFGALKYYEQLYHCDLHNANAVVACRRDHVYGSVSKKYIKRQRRRKTDVSSSMEKKRKRDAVDSESRLAALGPELVDSIMRVSRSSGKKRYRDDALAARARADAASIARGEEKIEATLEKQTKCFVKAQDALVVDLVNSDADVMGRTLLTTLTKRLDEALAREPKISGKRRLLVDNIKSYTLGRGIAAVEPKSFSSEVDASIGAVGSEMNNAFLRSALIGAYSHIKAEKIELLNEPAVPEMHRRVLPALGTPTLQRVAFESEQLRGAEALSAAAADYRARPSAPTARPRRRAQKPDLPAIDDELVTRQQRVDVAWELTYNRRGGGQLVKTFWCPGRITRVRSDSRGGWIHVEYDDKSSGWLLASRPSFWMAEKAGAWRFEVTEDADGDADDEGDGDHDLVDADDDGRMSDDEWGDEDGL